MNKLEQYKNIIKYDTCPVCGNKDMMYEKMGDNPNVARPKEYPFELSVACYIDKDITNYSHYFQNIDNENHTYWNLRYKHNGYVYEITNSYKNGLIRSYFYFSETGHKVDWVYSPGKDFSNLSKEEVIKLIDKAVLLK